MSLLLLLFVANIMISATLDNGVARTPQMGWNSWNHFACNISDTLIKSTIDAMVSSGLRDVGYIYVNLDDCWQSARDKTTNVIIPDPHSFPNGIESLVSYAHSNGLKFGLYSDAGNATCQKRPGSLGYETIDANTYALWSVDYIKYDNCYNEGIDPRIRYQTMSDALIATGATIFYAICEWGQQQPWLWAPDMANSWRTTGDIKDNWEAMLENWDNNSIATPGKPGAWNDPDMLEIGNGGMSVTEYITHFSLWCIGKAPLLIGCDVVNMDNDTKMILMNEEAIAINQDELGIQSQIIYNSNDDTMQIYSAPLSEDNIAVAMLNRNNDTKQMNVIWQQLNISDDKEYAIRDLWKHENITTTQSNFSANVEGHGIVFLRMYPVLSTHLHHDHSVWYIAGVIVVLMIIFIGVFIYCKHLKVRKLQLAALTQEYENVSNDDDQKESVAAKFNPFSKKSSHHVQLESDNESLLLT